VSVYGATWCRYTRAALDWFEARNIPARLRNVETEPEAWDEMAERAQRAGISTRGIPVLDVRGRILVGFHPEDIERALEE
jgi:arsenate reductase-like glutaredoxin family protein